MVIFMGDTDKLIEQHQKDLERIENFRLMDDDFMTRCFDGNIEATELLLKIVLKMKLTVQKVTTQVHVKNLMGKSVFLDILAFGEDGKCYNIEIQRAEKGASPKRARYHSSMMDMNTLIAGDRYEQLPEHYVIFITESDVLKLGKPLYRIERCIMETEPPILFGDEAHIVYVNGEIQDETDLGQLMHDFHCTNPNDMHYKVLAEKVRYYKQTEEGVAVMCKAMEEMRKEAVLEDRRRQAWKMIAKGKLSHEDIADYCELSLDEVKALAQEKSA